MNVLAIDTATALLGIGLEAGENYYEFNQNVGLHHTEHLLVEIQELLKKAALKAGELDLLVVSKGPGSFTGLRIGMSAAKGFAFAAGIPLVSVPTLDLYAYGRESFDGLVVPVMDARKQRIYTAFYERGIRKSEYLDLFPASIAEHIAASKKVLFTGPYADSMLGYLSGPEVDVSLESVDMKIDPLYGSPASWQLVQLGKTLFREKGADADSDGPLYIRPSEAELSLQGQKSQ